MRRTHELLTSHPGPACFVSLAHPRTFSDTSSAPISITGLGSRRKSAVQPLADGFDIGRAQLADRDELDASRSLSWSVHLIVAGPARNELKRTLAIEASQRVQRCARPPDVGSRKPGPSARPLPVAGREAPGHLNRGEDGRAGTRCPWSPGSRPSSTLATGSPRRCLNNPTGRRIHDSRLCVIPHDRNA